MNWELFCEIFTKVFTGMSAIATAIGVLFGLFGVGCLIIGLISFIPEWINERREK